MTNLEGLNKLKELSTQLETVEYSDIIEILKNTIRKIPISIAKLEANTAIDRARKNIGESLFDSVEELTYLKDSEKIKTLLLDFGRANMPLQPMFYAAIESSLIPHQRHTAIAEISELYQNPDGVNLAGELYTVSRWRNTKELYLAEMVFSQDAINSNPDIKRRFEKQSEFAKKFDEVDIPFYLDFLVFMSDQFARQKTTHHDYKISTAYTNLVLTHRDIDGVSYPSVQTQYKGENIVLPPQTVDSFLQIDVLSIQRLHRNKKNVILNNFKNCTNPKECYNKLVWKDLAPQYIKPHDEIQEALISEK